MTMEQFDSFLVEMQSNGQYVLLMDFKSRLSGNGAYTKELKEQVEAAGLEEKVFKLDMDYHPKDIFAGLYGVK